MFMKKKMGFIYPSVQMLPLKMCLSFFLFLSYSLSSELAVISNDRIYFLGVFFGTRRRSPFPVNVTQKFEYLSRSYEPFGRDFVSI